MGAENELTVSLRCSRSQAGARGRKLCSSRTATRGALRHETEHGAFEPDGVSVSAINYSSDRVEGAGIGRKRTDICHVCGGDLQRPRRFGKHTRPCLKISLGQDRSQPRLASNPPLPPPAYLASASMPPNNSLPATFAYGSQSATISPSVRVRARRPPVDP